MTRLYRTLLGIQSGPPVGTFAVTFTVKEWMLDPDNAFTDTEVDVLPYMTVKIDGVEQLTDANGQTTFNLAPGTHTYEVYDMVRYLTTVKGEVTVVDAAVAVGVKIYACLYTPTQVSEMISVEGYIPVASAAELDGLRNEVTQTMGAGTIWEQEYLTGLDKKYVQVRNIDLIEYANWNPIGKGSVFSGFYKGNSLTIDNMTITSTISSVNGLFNVINNQSSVDNLNLHNCSIESEHSDFGIIAGRLNGSCSNCSVVGSIVSGLNYGGVGFGLVIAGYNVSIIPSIDGLFISSSSVIGTNNIGGAIGNSNQLDANNIQVSNTDISGTDNIGGVIGLASTKTSEYVRFYDSSSLNCIISGREYTGGFTGRANARAEHYRCYADGVEITATGWRCGGFSGVLFTDAIAQNCFAISYKLQGTTKVGGFAGDAFGNAITNCYAVSYLITGSATVGGLCGEFGGTVVNSYYDKDTSGLSDTGKGLPRTTQQMKAGTADSFINPDGTIDATEDPDNAMYTDWDDTIWDFTDTNEYPELL